MKNIRVYNPDVFLQNLRSAHKLKNEGNEPFCCFHVPGICLPKLHQALGLISSGNGIQEGISDRSKTSFEQRWGLEENPPS